MYPDSLPLSECITGIVCRSQAEKETLKHLIRNSKNYNKYNDLINSAATGDLFYRRNIYIDSVTTSIDRNGESKTVVKFEYSKWNSLKVNKYEIKIKDKNSDRLYSAEGELEIKSPNPMKIIIPDKLRNIRIEIRLNGCLAFVSDRQTQPVYF